MDLTLLVKTMPSGQVEASVLEIPSCRVQSDTRDSAIAALKSNLVTEMQDTEVLDWKLPLNDLRSVADHQTSTPSAWKTMFGAFKNDTYFEEVMEIIQAERDALGDEEIDPAYYMP
jgi:hypothetical protein